MSEQNIPSIQWFPGHMAKTRRLIEENLKLVDAVIELLDARVPMSSQNPEIDRMVGSKPRLLVLNRADMADTDMTALWKNYFAAQNKRIVTTDCRSGKGVSDVLPAVRGILQPMLQRLKDRGVANFSVRLMIVGIPNVGKSSLINRLAGAKKTKVEDRPGVTRSKQWVPVGRQAELLDMPGVLWPKFDDPAVGEKLAFTGAVKDDVMDTEALACRLLDFLNKHLPGLIQEKFGISVIGSEEPFQLLELVARRRGMLISGGEPDCERTAIKVLDEFRGGKLGRITLESPKDVAQTNEENI